MAVALVCEERPERLALAVGVELVEVIQAGHSTHRRFRQLSTSLLGLAGLEELLKQLTQLPVSTVPSVQRLSSGQIYLHLAAVVVLVVQWDLAELLGKPNLVTSWPDRMVVQLTHQEQLEETQWEAAQEAEPVEELEEE